MHHSSDGQKDNVDKSQETQRFMWKPICKVTVINKVNHRKDGMPYKETNKKKILASDKPRVPYKPSRRTIMPICIYTPFSIQLIRHGIKAEMEIEMQKRPEMIKARGTK